MNFTDLYSRGIVPGPDGQSAKAPPIVFFDDFVDGSSHTPNKATVADSQGKFSQLANMGTYLVTLVDGDGDNAQTILPADDAPGGHVVFTPNNKAVDSITCQANGEAFKLAADKTLIIEARVTKTHATTSDWFIGLGKTLGTLVTNSTDFIGFGNTAGAADLLAVNGKNCTAGEIADPVARDEYTFTDTGIDQVAATFNTVRVEIDGTTEARFYVDGVLKATHTTNLPDDEAMTPSIYTRCTGTTQTGITVDYILVAQER